jgi:hypothetical protein
MLLLVIVIAGFVMLVQKARPTSNETQQALAAPAAEPTP